MNDRGSYEFPAWCQMETALDSYEQDRAAYLEREADALGPPGRDRLEQFNKAADSLVKGVQNLAGVDGIACLQDLAETNDFQRDKPFELLEEHVCIIGWRIGQRPSRAVANASERHPVYEVGEK